MAYKDKGKAIQYNNEYNKTAYDRINLVVPKGEKDNIKAHSDKMSESVNGFIFRAIKETMQRDNSQDEKE